MRAKPARAKATSNDFAETFRRLRAILARYADKLRTVHDTPDHFYLVTLSRSYEGKPMFFGAARIMKNYVSFHFMPLYVCPEMSKRLSKELSGRRQGKACFNFQSPDDLLFMELEQLVDAGFERYRKEKLL
jgi:hypothetical protein